MLDRDFDLSFYRKGYRIICGTDEAGRGPLAGPVVAGACILPEGAEIPGLDDSKKLTEKKREKLYDDITSAAIAWGAGLCTAGEIDEMNILEASLTAMRRAISATGVTPDLVLVDGNISRGFDTEAIAVVGGDAKSQSIAAASVIAKVTRDRLMTELDAQYPGYGLAKHKGYPTKDHKLAVYMNGPSPIHRRSFLSFLEKDEWLEDAAKAKLESEKNKDTEEHT